MRTLRLFGFAATLGVACFSPRPAAAGNPAAAEALFNQAHAAMDAKDYDTACQRFAESNRLDPAVGTVLNLGVCEAARGRVATAWELFHEAYQKLDPNDPRRDYAKSHADALEPRLPKLTLTLAAGAPADTTAEEGDAAYGGAAFGVPLPMDPGKHTFSISAAGHEPRTMEIEIGEGAAQVLELAPGAESVVPGGPASTAPAPPWVAPPFTSSTPEHKDTRTLGWVLGGVGVAGLGIGAITGGLALGKKATTDDECSSVTRTCSQRGKDAASAGRSLAVVSTVGWITGILGVGAGAYFILTSGPHGEKTAVVTEIGPAGTSLAFSKVF